MPEYQPPKLKAKEAPKLEHIEGSLRAGIDFYQVRPRSTSTIPVRPQSQLVLLPPPPTASVGHPDARWPLGWRLWGPHVPHAGTHHRPLHLR